jgi:hypothetical protein
MKAPGSIPIPFQVCGSGFWVQEFKSLFQFWLIWDTDFMPIIYTIIITVTGLPDSSHP